MSLIQALSLQGPEGDVTSKPDPIVGDWDRGAKQAESRMTSRNTGELCGRW